jgi:hypothetical protein
MKLCRQNRQLLNLLRYGLDVCSPRTAGILRGMERAGLVTITEPGPPPAKGGQRPILRARTTEKGRQSLIQKETGPVVPHRPRHATLTRERKD